MKLIIDNREYYIQLQDVPEVAKKIQKLQTHIWIFDSSMDKYLSDKYLSQDEIYRANQFKFNKHLQRFLFFRKMMRYILSTYCNVPSKKINYKFNLYGKPYVEEGVKFNLSHSQDLGILAINKDCEVGVDIELITLIEDIDSIAKHFFSKSEYNKLMELSTVSRNYHFFEIWTRKEAFIKNIGQGLSFPLDKFEVSFKDETSSPKILNVKNSSLLAQAWSLSSFHTEHAGDKYLAAWVVQNTDIDAFK